MVKVAIDCRMLGKSGIGVFLQNIIDIWIEKNECSFVLIGNAKALSKYAKLPNCRVVNFDANIFSFSEQLYFPTREINTCDIFYSPNFNIAKGIKIPVVITIHDVVFLDIKNLTSKLGYWIRYFSIKRALNMANAVVTVSKFSRSRILSHFKTKNEIIVAYNGVRKDLTQIQISDLKPKYDFEYYVFVGNIKQYKGIDLLLSAITNTNHKLVIVGTNRGMKIADKSIDDKIVGNNNIVFAGKLNDLDLYAIIANAKALVQPSRYEGFGIPPLEALYLNTPVIMSDIEVFKEVYSQLPVIFFENGNINSLTERLKNLPKVSIDSSTIYAAYNYEQTSTKIMSLLNSIISNTQKSKS